jgi:hypothetical protein
MTDKEILNEVYARLNLKTDNGFEAHTFKSITEFIEREWQKQDEQEYDETVPSFSKQWYTDVRDMERHRGLEIGPDGTVMEVK